MELAQAIGANISRLRDRRGLDQMALAAEIGITKRFLGRIEAGAANPTLTLLERIAEALQIGPAELLREDQSLKN